MKPPKIQTQFVRFVRKFALIIVAVAAALVYAAFLYESRVNAVREEETPVAFHEREGDLIVVPEKSELRRYLSLAAVQQQRIEAPLEAPAVLEADPAKVANILPPLAGRISALHVHLGDAVVAGQPLFTIDSADLAQARADLQHAETSLKLTRKALARQQDLYDHGAIAALKDLEQAQADYAGAQSDYERATAVFRTLGIPVDSKESPRQLTVRSPLAGRISMLNAVQGTYANDNTAALLTVSDVSTIWFTASVQEKDLADIEAGEDLDATVQSFAGETFKGKVLFVSDQLDPDTRTVKVRAAYGNKDGRLKPGMFAKVTFMGKPKDAIVVPTTALVQDETRTLIFVEKSPWKFERRTVFTGARIGESTEIIKGLAAGERIVTKQGVLLND